MGCCSREEKDAPQGMVTEGRGCTDVLCLLLFGLFWGGMVFVGYEAIRNGSPERIIYGLDSYGNYCGSLNSKPDGTEVDLRKAPKLLYLNPLELLDTKNYQYASAVCVESCPTINTICNSTSLPCTQGSQYLCPYYGYSQFGKNGSDELGILSTKGAASTDWWDDLVNYQGTECADTAFLSSVPSEVADAMNATSSCGSYYQTSSMYPGKGPCSALYFETTEFMHRCYPVIPTSAQDSIASVSSSGLSVVPATDVSGIIDRISAMSEGGFNTYVTDAQRGFTIILACGLGASLVLCMFYMIVIRFFAGAMAWTVVLLVNLLFVAATILSAHKSGLLSTVPGTDGLADVLSATGNELTGNYQVAMRYMTYVMCALTVICFLLTLLMIRRIAVAVACLKVAASAIGTIPSLMLFPLITFISIMGLFIYWVIVFAHQWSAASIVEVTRQDAEPSSEYSLTTLFASASNTTANFASSLLPASSNTTAVSLECFEDPNCYYDVQFSKEQQYMFAYHLFGLLWTNQFINGFGYLVIAHSVGQYYWTRGLRSDMTTFPVLTGIWVASRYHMGSIAFGAFLVAVIQFVRLLLEYLDRKTKRMQKGNPAARWVMCCLRYCLWYLEKVMKFINRNSYIIVAVKGYTFCGGAMRAIKLIILNVGRLAAVNVIGDALIFIGKLTVVMASGSLAFLMTDMSAFSSVDSANYLTSPIVPVILTMLAAYMVSCVFFAVYEMAIDTILLSFCEDCSSNNEVPQFAPKMLMSALGKAKTFQDQQESKAKVADKTHDPP